MLEQKAASAVCMLQDVAKAIGLQCCIAEEWSAWCMQGPLVAT